MMAYHIPALLNDSVDGLNINPDGIYIDVTFGGGGHSLEILKRLSDKGRLIAFDRDEDVTGNIPDDSRFLFLNQNFRFLRNNLQYNGITEIDGLLADLGVSFHQFDTAERGFTFRKDAPLDMRMNRRGSRNASTVLNDSSEEQLSDIFYYYGELPNARQIAGIVCNARKTKPIATTGQLLSVLAEFAPAGKEHKFYAKLFQSLRIEVNHETDALKEMLLQALDMLKPAGRLSIITYQSLEDRIVKNFMKTGNFEGREEKDFYGNRLTPFKLITKKGITPDETEIAANNRARSARLRIAEKI